MSDITLVKGRHSLVGNHVNEEIIKNENGDLLIYDEMSKYFSNNRLKRK